MHTEDDAREFAGAIAGSKLWSDLTVKDGSPEVSAETLMELGYGLVFITFMEKASWFGDIDFGTKNWANKNTVYADLHDFDGYLLDEEGKPIKSWDLQGKISLIIGKAGRDQELDIDLSDCEYSSFIDFQHAVLNFCLDQWYVEDLGSQNGVKVGKVEDGECYRVIHRPCKVVAGDVLYIANTKLLLT